MLICDEDESAILPKGAPEIEQIRILLKRVVNRLTLTKQRHEYRLDAWVELPEDKSTFAGFWQVGNNGAGS